MTGIAKISIQKIFPMLLGALLLAPLPASAQMRDQYPILKKFEDEGGKVDFLGHAYGMDGWIVLNREGKAQYVYTTPEGGVVVGMMFSAEGEPETAKQLEAYKQRMSGSQEPSPGAENSSSKSEKLYAAAEKAEWVSFGSVSAPYLYMFANVNCDHCQLFWKDLEKAVKDGKLQVRMVPYGEAVENRNGGAALLSVDNPEEAWTAYAAGDKTALSADKAKPEGFTKLEANTALAKEWRLAPPFTLYRRPGDGKLIAVVGRPENSLLLLSEFLR